MKDFQAGLCIYMRERVGASKALPMKFEEASVKEDRVLEVMLSLPRTLRSAKWPAMPNRPLCSVAGLAELQGDRITL